LIRGNYLFLCLGFASTLTFDLHEYEVLKDQLFKFIFFCWTAKKKQKKNGGSSTKEANIYWKKKVEKEGSKKKGGSSTQLLLQFICDLLISTCNQSFS